MYGCNSLFISSSVGYTGYFQFRVNMNKPLMKLNKWTFFFNFSQLTRNVIARICKCYFIRTEKLLYKVAILFCMPSNNA